MLLSQAFPHPHIHWQLLAGWLAAAAFQRMGLQDLKFLSGSRSQRGPRRMSPRNTVLYSCLESDAGTGVLGAEGRG